MRAWHGLSRIFGVRGLLFVARCSASATLAFVAAVQLGLGHPVWATISALIVSQESLAETRRSLGERCVGTLIGIAVALAVHGAAQWTGSEALIPQIAVVTALCAMIARERPTIRVCMWTGPLVLLTATRQVPLTVAGLHRGSEVILGAIIGASLHTFSEFSGRPFLAKRAARRAADTTE